MNTKKNLIIKEERKIYVIRRCCINSILAVLLCIGLLSPSLVSLAEESKPLLEDINNQTEKPIEISETIEEISLITTEIHNENPEKINPDILKESDFPVITVETKTVSIIEEYIVEEENEEKTKNHIEQEKNIIEEEINPEPEKLVVQTLIREIPNIVICYDDIRITSMATPDMIEMALQETWLEGYGELYYQLEKEYGINAFLAIANAFQETGWDINKSNLAMQHNNIYGLKNKSFNSIEECIRYYFDLISNHYITEGYTSMAQINTKYCPPDSSWSTDIYSIANKLNNKVTLTLS